VDLATTWLGLELPHPLVVGASPIVDDLDLVRRAEDAGAAAIVMHSLFEEQIALEEATHEWISAHGEYFAEARSYLMPASEFTLGPEAYLEQLHRIKAAVSIPVVGSLNGVTHSGWLHWAQRIEAAGADALELNVYAVAHAPERVAAAVEDEVVHMVQHVVRDTRIPVAVKLSPFWTSLGHFARRIEHAGAKGLVLFNRFYQPDIDPETLDVSLQLRLSDPTELLLRLRWLALLAGRTQLSLCASGGVHAGSDALKAVMAGADAVQMVSALLRKGPEHIGAVRDELARWLEQHEYDSLRQARGSLSLARCPDPGAWERGNYVRMLQGYARRPS
jgi:dihydroorotate dehydrogenase (fumarate)